MVGLRGAVGLLVAYAVALQITLAALIGAHALSADPTGQAMLCETVDASSGSTPGKIDRTVNHAKCIVCGLASLPPPGPDVASAFVFRSALVAAYPVHARKVTHARRHDPKSAQGPPENA